MATLATLRGDLYFWLGTTDANEAFPPAQMTRLLNMAAAALYEDLIRTLPDPFTQRVTLVADVSTPSSYPLASQTPPITNLGTIVEVRETDQDGCSLREVPFRANGRCDGSTYSVIGQESTLTLYTGSDIREGVGLYLVYVPLVADLASDSDSPSWLRSDFHDVLSLAAARLAYGSGNEQQMSPIYLDRLQDREAQLRWALGNRSLEPTVSRR